MNKYSRVLKKYIRIDDAKIYAFIMSFIISLLVVFVAWLSNSIHWTVFRIVAFISCMCVIALSISHSATCMKYGGCNQYSTFILLSSYSLFMLLLVNI
jgi:hypothetical protein